MYINSLVAEVSQQMYGGTLRCISLVFTEGLSTWRCNIQLNVQAVVVPVGTVSLGRILNVVGAAVDLFNDQPTAVVYGESPICRSNVGEAFGNGPGAGEGVNTAVLEVA
jgi:F0F1-type ATP synthase beta subunit